MNERPAALLPEILLAGGAVVGLLAGSFLPRRRQVVVRGLTLVVALAALAASAVGLASPVQSVFGGSYAVDLATGVARVVVIAATVLAGALAVDSLAGHPRESEYYVLLLLAALGTVVLAGATDLLLLVAGYLLASVPVYALAGFAKDAAGTEAALKYYLFGAFLGIGLLAGVAVLFGAAGTTAYAGLRTAAAAAPPLALAGGGVAVLAGLLFKAGAVPAHFWVPDVTAGSPPPVAAFVTTVPKVGALLAAYRLVEQVLGPSRLDWPLLLALVAAATMTLGNLAAFGQHDPRRLLAYSTISQVGYLLLAVAVAGRTGLALPSLGGYLAGYALTNLGAFAVVCQLPRAARLADYRGLFAVDRRLALSLVVCLLGLVGTPPTAVFVGKVAVFAAAGDGGQGWLVVAAAVNTVASLFYYLRWIAPLFAGAPDAALLAPAGRWSRLVAYGAALGSVALGLAGGAVLAVGGAVSRVG